MTSALPSAGRTIHAVVLAAGGSSRLGRPKQLLRFGHEPLVVRATRLAQGACDGRIIVVVGAEQLRVRAALRRHLGKLPRIVCNARWREGLSGSLQAGLANVPQAAKAALIVLVDQPHIGPVDLDRLTRGWRERPNRATAAFYAGHAGVPAVIPRRYFGSIRKLGGDEGARRLLRNPDRTALVSMPAAAFDIDTPEDATVINRPPGSHNLPRRSRP